MHIEKWFQKSPNSILYHIFRSVCPFHFFCYYLFSFAIISIKLNYKSWAGFIWRNLKVHHIYLDVFQKYLLTNWFIATDAKKKKRAEKKSSCHWNQVWSKILNWKKCISHAKMVFQFVESEFGCSSGLHLVVVVVGDAIIIPDSTINHLIGNWFKNCISLAWNDKNIAFPGHQQQAKHFI